VFAVTSMALAAAACGSDTDSSAGADGSVPANTAPNTNATDATTTGTEPMTTELPTDQTTTEPMGSRPAATVEATGTGSTMDRLAEIAIADAASRFGVDAATITLVSATAVTWRDGAAGCPVKGMQYTQVLTPGSVIVLDVDGTNRQYHTGGRRTDPFYCAQPERPSSTEP
jgi:hypothetical protein